MSYTVIDAALLKKMFYAGSANLRAKKEWINELNVFPVPDGDTGTNMTMTIMSAAKALAELESNDMKSVCKAISSGSLRGARGNSGVILSQLLRGFAKICGTYDEITVDVLVEAFQRATETAYKAVMKPKEGTILTVAKGAADKAIELGKKKVDVMEFGAAIVEEADRILQTTPDLLPVLKQAGVVDSGGQGLVVFLQGALEVLNGKDFDEASLFDEAAAAAEAKVEAEASLPYVVALTINAKAAIDSKKLSDLKAVLESNGKNVVLSGNGAKATLKMCTAEPGTVLNASLNVGVITDVSVEFNGILEGTDEPVVESAPADMPPKDMGFVGICTGEGLTAIFKELGCDEVISGGQTMNPSTEDILAAVEKVNAKSVFILPNNKNIILAANQAADICEDKKLYVIPTKTIPQGITALINFVPDGTASDNAKAMSEEINNVKTGQVTYAVRDTQIDEFEIHTGDFMGMGDSGMLSVAPTVEEAFLQMVEKMIDADSSILSIYYGEDVKEEEAVALSAKLTEKYSGIDVETSYGGQAVYSYIISVE